MSTKTNECVSVNLPITECWDVLVAGGGPAGCAAAAAAAREGARTLLVEATGCLGGMGTAGLVPAWMPWWDGEKPVVGGFAERIIRASCVGRPQTDLAVHNGFAPIDAEKLKRIYDDLVVESGATVLFNTQLISVQQAEGGADTVVLANKGGLCAHRAKVYVDCTGDADLAVAAGATFVQGDPTTGELMPVTHCFTLAHVDDFSYIHVARKHWNEMLTRLFESGRYREISDRHSCHELVGPGTIGFNAGHQWDVDNLDPVGVSQALIQGRKIAQAYRNALAEFLPEAFGNAFVVNTASLLGVREGRRIIGDYILSLEDYLQRQSFADEICRNHYPVDIHTAKHEVADEKAGKFSVMSRYEHYTKGESHGIPYRCLCPKDVRNVLVAGRSISCERAVQSSIRIMPVCLGMGEAAGLAAALATQSTGDIHAVNTVTLRERLRDYGAYLPAVAD